MSWLEVQMAVLPLLLPVGIPRTLYSPFDPPRDLCVSAPTGSGKTLSYVIPIVEVRESPRSLIYHERSLTAILGEMTDSKRESRDEIEGIGTVAYSRFGGASQGDFRIIWERNWSQGKSLI